jgi:hypothetical protein
MNVFGRLIVNGCQHRRKSGGKGIHRKFAFVREWRPRSAEIGSMPFCVEVAQVAYL